MKDNKKTREQWLTEATEEMRPWFIEKNKPLPEIIYVGVGWMKGVTKNAIGVCHSANQVKDEKRRGPAIWICPTQGEDAVRVLDILLHELCHAALPIGTGHKKPFKDLAFGFGLEGKATATTCSKGSELWHKLNAISEKLGPYPHAPMVKVAANKGGGSNGWVRLKSLTDDRYKVVISEKSLESFGYPVDPFGSTMVRV